MIIIFSLSIFNVCFSVSQGIDAPGNQATSDSRVFALCLLLSTVFVYNTMSLIEENSLRHLSFVTSLAAHINPANEEHASVAFPRLLWLVRDFQYWKDLESKFGGNANKYMESVLTRSAAGAAGAGKAGDDNDNIREGLSKIFPLDRRSCYLLPTPALDTENLIDLPEAQINPKFVDNINKLVTDTLPKLVSAKCKGTTPLRGDGYARLVETCVAAMNEEVQEVTLFIPNIRARFASNEAEELYDRGVEFDSKKFPMSDEEVRASHESRFKAALNLFNGKAYGPTKEALESELRSRLETKFESLKRRNSELRDRAFLGFGQLNTAVVAAIIVFVVAAISPLPWTMLMAGTVCIAYYMGQFYTITNNFAQFINMGIALWEAHVKQWADANPQAMVAIILLITLLLWWVF